MPFVCWIFIGVVIASSILLYRWFVKDFDIFVGRGIPGPPPSPLFGTWWGCWKLKQYQVELDRYNNYGRLYGTFDGRSPNLVVGDPVLIRKILISDFESFVNRRDLQTSNVYLNNGLSALKDGHWKLVRSCLSPAFTIGRIRQMHDLMSECAKSLVHHLLLQTSSGDKGKVNIKAAVASYTLDVIASCAFGTKIDSFQKPNNHFVSTATKIFSSAGAGNPIFTLFFLYPQIAQFLIPPSMFKDVNFIAKLADEIVRRRRAEPLTVKRADFLDCLLEASESDMEGGGENPLKKDETLIAQVIIFLLAGFDTTGLTLALTVHFLAVNPRIQVKVRQEIQTHLQKHELISYDLLHELPYLEQCISETLRICPPAIRIERMCSRRVDYDRVSIPPGMMVSIPILAIHRDPEFYADPLVYDPQRFSPEEKSKRDPMTYLPFGSGQRQCIGMRFALQEIKLGLCHLLTKFNFFPIPETVDPPVFDSGTTFGLLQNQHIWVGVEQLKPRSGVSS